MEKMKFELEIIQDPTADEINRTLQRYRQMNHSAYDAFICVVLSHGRLGVVLGRDGKLVAISDITMMFTPDLCPSLTGKPKVFFIQACQGDTSSGWLTPDLQ